jgi:starch synthase
MRIAIATTGRFHVLDLARELCSLGHQVAFWSMVPKRRAVRFGLPEVAHRSLLPLLFPLVVAHRHGGQHLSQLANRPLLAATDRLIAQRLEPCDVFIGMSGLAVHSARAARERFGAKVFIERGSQHILAQKAILDELRRLSPDVQTVPDYAVRLHEASNQAADVITVPSQQAATTFLDHGWPAERLFLNPYGVDLDMFVPTPAPAYEQLRVMFVGAWSYQKGCDLLADAVASFQGRVSLLHVGVVGDAPLPRQNWFQHLDPIPQWQLREHYTRAHAFVIASRQEGLALVQAQALACGLPIVCTDRTGGEDLKNLLGLDDGIFLVPHDDASRLANGIERALYWAQRRFHPGAVRDLLGCTRERLSWRAYGKRYSEKLSEILAAA